MNARISRLLKVWLFAACTAACLVFSISPALAQPVPDKISGEILAHQQEKQVPPGLAVAQHRAALQARGIHAENLDGEECALYCVNQLTPQEIVQLRAQGIVVNADIWIPPLPGSHPTGFHLATVSYQSLDVVRNDARFVRLESVEFLNKRQNDGGAVMINSDDVINGNGVPARNGNGVRIAVADSGLDRTHADFPVPVEAYDVTTGTGTNNWSTNVANTVSDHGTHVTGTVLGRGTLSGGRYRGSAPGASLLFYKIGNNTNAQATDADMIEAINRAVVAGAKVFTMSYGGYSTYMDGSESVEQAIDTATDAGVTVFISAGNDGDASEHDSASVAPATASAAFGFAVNNAGVGSTYTGQEWIRLLYRDNNSADGNMVLHCSNLGAGESLTQAFSAASGRGTESKRFVLTPNIAANGSKTYNLILSNTATSGTTPLVHCYRVSGKGTFTNPDSSYTVTHPAVADTAITVGAWTHRKAWTNFLNQLVSYSDVTVGTLAGFSSRGPRVDGVRKPEIVAPGAGTISARDSVANLATNNAYIIDNDGLNLNGSGPANYYVQRGTSMASPMAAGVAALLLQNNSSLTPAQIRQALTSTASLAAAPDNNAGFGLINALAAIQTFRNITINNVAVTEGNAGTVNADFTVTLSGISPVPTSVSYSTAPGSAAAGTDYITTNGVLVIPAGSTTGTITVRVNGDTLNESNETFFVNLSNPTNGIITDAQGQGTITNDDPLPTVSINDVALLEANAGTANVLFSVTLSAASGLPVSFACGTSNFSATAGADYIATNRVITLAAGTTGTSFTVPVIGELIYESNETFFVNLSSPTNATLGDAQGSCTITNNDNPPAVSINDLTVTEGNSGTTNAIFTVSLSITSGITVLVTFNTTNNSATAGTDYIATNRTMVIPPGVGSAIATIPVLGDVLAESNETYFVNLSNPTNATIADFQGVGTINDDDQPLIANFTASTTNGFAPLTVVFTNLTAGSTNTFWNFGDGKTSTAANPTNTYTNAGLYSVTLTAAGPSGSNSLTRSNYITATTPQAGALRFSAGVYTRNETGSIATVNVLRAGGSDGAVTVSFSTSNGTATAGADFTHTNGVLNWTNGETATKTFTVALIDDLLYESNETFIVRLSNPTGGATLGNPSNATVTITENDPAPVLSVFPFAHDFGVMQPGTTGQISFFIYNNPIFGGSLLTGTATISTGAFSIVSGVPFTVAGGQTSAPIVVLFSPPLEGSYSNAIVFTSNGNSSTNKLSGVAGIAPTASFTGSPRTGGAPLMVAFTDVSTGTITNRDWDFGDGIFLNTGTTNVVHTYTNAGTYTVDLSVSGPAGSATFLRSDYIVVTNTLLSNLVLTNSSLSNGIFRVEILTAVGRTYTLQFISVLGMTNWISLPPINGDGSNRFLLDPAATNAQRFYRVLREP